jgi:hypothetical protein
VLHSAQHTPFARVALRPYFERRATTQGDTS